MMEENQYKKDVYKETLMILSNFDEETISKIPDEFLQKLNELAADSKMEFYFDKEKELSKQNMSEECKDLLTLIYYKFIENRN